jgi:hypothetical protein
MKAFATFSLRQANVDDATLFKAGCESIITYNTRDFAGVEQFGLKLLNPSEFLCLIGKLP